LQYTITEGDETIEVTQGIHGKVLCFSDGTTTVCEQDGEAITLRPDNSMTIVAEGLDGNWLIKDIPPEKYDETIIYFDSARRHVLCWGTDVEENK
jgi:uncharacterized cupin superfamily protein